MRRLIGAGVWALGILMLTAQIITGIGETGCGGCYEKSCTCADGTTLPTESGPCSCPGLCSSHGGECTGICTDAGKDATPDAPTDGAVSCAFNGSVVEPCGACNAGTCCVSADAGGCNASCAAPSLWWCFAPSDCVGGSGSICCLSASTIGADCPHTLGETSTSCSISCNGPRVCVVDGDCPANQHCQTAIEGPVTVGICGS